MSVLKKGPKRLFVYIGDYTTHLHGVYFITIMTGSLLNNQDSTESQRVFFVAQMMKFPLKLTVGP